MTRTNVGWTFHYVDRAINKSGTVFVASNMVSERTEIERALNRQHPSWDIISANHPLEKSSEFSKKVLTE